MRFVRSVIPTFCAACSRVTRDPLCESCRDELDELSLRGGASLFRYSGLVRQLVLRAKAGGDHTALRLLLRLAADRAEAARAAAACDAVVASPSSLWGRMRGRLDVAHALAADLAARHGKPLVPAPLDLHWRWRKRARQSRQEREAEVAARREVGAAAQNRSGALRSTLRRHWAKRWAPLCAGRAILLVDDVTTTGLTAGEVRAALEDAAAPARITLLTIAKARR